LSQFRFEKAVSFICFRCAAAKTSKSITICNENWDYKICNGCYGYLLSIHNIKNSTDPDEKKFEALDKCIEQLARDYKSRIIAFRNKLDKSKSEFEDSTRRFLATAACLEEDLPKGEFLEWSPAVLCLCKAVENELINKFLIPMRNFGLDMATDKSDPRTKRVDQFLSRETDTPPELGGISFYINLVAKSSSYRDKAASAPLLKTYSEKRPFFDWYTRGGGAASDIETIVTKFRNRAAHISELAHDDFQECKELVLGSEGILSNILRASQPK
jgi:hypothetical protein